MDRALSSMLSLSMKAGKLKTGDSACVKALRSGEAKLIILAVDASGNTKKKFINKSKFYNTPVYIYNPMAVLSHSTGVVNRAVFAVTDSGFATNIEKRLSQNDEARQVLSIKDANITEACEWRK